MSESLWNPEQRQKTRYTQLYGKQVSDEEMLCSKGYVRFSFVFITFCRWSLHLSDGEAPQCQAELSLLPVFSDIPKLSYPVQTDRYVANTFEEELWHRAQGTAKFLTLFQGETCTCTSLFLCSASTEKTWRWVSLGVWTDANSTTEASIVLPVKHTCLVGSRLLHFPPSLDTFLSSSHPKLLIYFQQR